ncbi:hypothetical protein HRI_004744400 [Hibiscus trionum]|uniref:Uncharacterized protein n=1 Tax=Hibiscus trionum TaxID=183268 RepID=A0A9W7MS83_HIBTR|nr:hypothetical protein HRI_004744400 [Hibiscus trionum]
MSINAKGIQLFLWRIIRFSGSYCYKFVRRFPDVSGFLIFILFLYIFSPYVFFYFMYSSPVIVCSAIYIRFYLKTKIPESQRIKEKDSGERLSADGELVNTSNKPSLRPQKSVRRNARKEVLEWDGKHSEENDVLFVRSMYEEGSKLIFGRVGSSKLEHGDGSPHDETGIDRALDVPNTVFDNETSKPHRVSDDSFRGLLGTGPGDGKLPVKSSEEAGGAGKKATQDYQKNRMDLGLTELERNKRLQSLIAKRRTKMLFRIAIEKSLMGIHNVPCSQLASILSAKNNIGGVPSNLDQDGLTMPGSAPYLLSPKRNSFDLPYDPQEEKPNLMADSFQREFAADNQKEMFFCRHESFHRGPWFPYPTAQNPNDAEFNLYYSDEKRLVEGKSDKLGHHRLNSSGIENDIVFAELEEPNYNEVINLSEEKKEKIIESLNNRTEIGEKMENPHDLEPGLDSGSEVRMETDSIKNNDSCYSSSSENTEPVLDQTIKSTRIRNDHVRRALKLAIPPKGRAMNRLSFGSSLSPSERCRTEFNSFYSRRQCHTPTFSIASDLQVEVSEAGSPPLTTDGTVSSVDGDSVICDGDVDRDINSESEEVWGGSVNLSREEVNRERLRELDDISEEESVAAASISPSEHESKQNLNSKSSLSSRIDITENGASHPTYISSEAHQGSSNCRHGNLETLYEVKSTIESGKEVKESQPLKYIEEDTRTLTEHNTRDAPNAVQSRDNLKSVPDTKVDQVEESQPSKYIEEDTRTLTEHNTRDAPNAVQSRDNLKSVPDTKVDQYAAENNILEKRLRDSIARALNRRLMLEQVSVSSSPSPSPRSVLPQNILAGPIPISGVGRRMQRSLSHFVRKDVVRSNLAYGQAREKLTANMSHIAHEWVENSINQLTRNLSFGTFEMAPRKVIGEGNNNSEGIRKEERKKLTANEGESVFLIRQEDISGSGKSNEEEADMNEIETIESNYTRIVESAKEGETANEDESLILIRPGDISGPEKSNEQEVDMNNTETIESDYTSIVESAKEREISAAEVDRICKSNDSVADNVTKKGIKNYVLEREGALQILDKLETVIEPSNTTGETSAVSVEDAENEPKRLANAGQSTSAGETNNLNNINSGQEMQNITRQEGIKEASKSGEGNNIKAIDSIPDVDNITQDTSKATESEVKATKTE